MKTDRQKTWEVMKAQLPSVFVKGYQGTAEDMKRTATLGVRLLELVAEGHDDKFNAQMNTFKQHAGQTLATIMKAMEEATVPPTVNDKHDKLVTAFVQRTTQRMSVLEECRLIKHANYCRSIQSIIDTLKNPQIYYARNTLYSACSRALWAGADGEKIMASVMLLWG